MTALLPAIAQRHVLPGTTRPGRFGHRFVSLLLLSALVLPCAAHAQVDLHAAEQDVLNGQADRAVQELQSMLGAGAAAGPGHLLLCRAYLSELRGGEAATECQKALESGMARNSAAQDWAGRAFGMQAQHAGPISGLKLAGQVRNAFLTAYKLDPRNPAAANDIGEFYVNAPFLVGGGIDKANALAGAIEGTLPEISHRLRALIADKQGDHDVAEQQFLAATQVAQSPGAYVDLACFYARQHASDKATAAARRAIALNRAVDANVVDAAGCLNDVHQSASAVPALRNYLDHGKKSDQAPAFRAHTLLGDIYGSGGDKAAARREYQAALALASNYGPAQKGLASL